MDSFHPPPPGSGDAYLTTTLEMTEMSEEKLAFVDENTTAAPQVETPDTPADPPPAEVKGDTPAAPPAAPEDKAAHIPISALLDERERRQKAEKEAEEGRQFRRQQEARQREAAMQDPEQRRAYEHQQFHGMLMEQRLSQSRFMAEREFGKEEVAAAYAYFDQHPQLSHQLLSHPSPFHAAVEFVRRQKIADEVGSDPEAWRAREREKLRAELMAETPQPQPQQRLPGSLAAAPAAGRAGEPRPRGSAFDAAFGG